MHLASKVIVKCLQLLIGGMHCAGFVQLTVVEDDVHVVHWQLFKKEGVESRVGREQHAAVDQQAGGPEFRAGVVALGRDVHGAKNNQPDALDFRLINFPWQLGDHVGEDEIGQVIELKRAVLAVLAAAAQGAFPKEFLVRFRENEPGGFVNDVVVEKQEFLQAPDMVGVAVGDMVVVEIPDADAA